MSCECVQVHNGCVNTNNCSIVAYGQRPEGVAKKEASPESPTAEAEGSPPKD